MSLLGEGIKQKDAAEKNYKKQMVKEIESMKDMFFEVYVPLEYTDKKDKRKKLAELNKEIIKILKDLRIDI